MRPRIVRSMREFAEAEIVLPNGPRAGMPFSCRFMPWSGAVLDILGSDTYRRFFGSGPVQSGKTLIFFVIVVMYYLFEVGETVIIGVPDVDMAQGIYEERLLPVILKSRYRDMIPDAGAGSKGGKFKAIRFRNGAWLRFMGAGGGDQQRSSHTARIVVLTELDKMDQPGKASREADPVTQIEARSRAYGSRARIYGECTMSIKTGRVYKEVCEFGTDTQVFLQCPHCGSYVAPDREHFLASGVLEASNIMEAQTKAGYACQECGTVWTEADRQAALKRPVLAARGQTVNPDGSVSGEKPRTNTFGFRWNAMSSGLLSMADIAETEYRAEHSDNPNDLKSVVQFTWAEPWTDDLQDLSGINRETVLAKIGHLPRGVLPAETRALTVFIDLGKYTCWWSAWAWRDEAVGYLIDYGSIQIAQGRETKEIAILNGLRSFRDEVLATGWQDGSDTQARRTPDMVLVDSGWESKVAYDFCLESRGRYYPSKGLGSNQQASWTVPKPAKGKIIGREWCLTNQPGGVKLVTMNSDYWKAMVHDGFASPAGQPGSLQLYKAEKRDHQQYARQIVAEREEIEFEAGKGTRKYWNQISRYNHWLDCAYGCRAAADMLGIKMAARSVARPTTKYRPVGPQRAKSAIRTRY